MGGSELGARGVGFTHYKYFTYYYFRYLVVMPDSNAIMIVNLTHIY